MKCVNLKGEVIQASKGYSAIIEIEGKILETTKVESVSILRDQVIIETQNTTYFIKK